jgi:hypothetical protein
MSEDVTVVCAAWHRQEHLGLLYEQHSRSLLAQSAGVRVVYVADGGLQLPPASDRITVVGVDRGITTGEALMVGLAITDTEYFAALNLDDSYFTDAIAAQIDMMKAGNLDMVGGDWEIRHTPQAHTDRPCYDLSTLRPCRQWPPSAEPGQRLGSGDGTNGTFGPAPVFRTSALRKIGGYPRQFGDGTRIRTIIDYIVWDRLIRTGARVGRLPLIVGSYYSNPAAQQEFRGESDDPVLAEHRRYEQHGALI